MSDFAIRIKKLREHFKETRAEFGQRINKSENTIYNWEMGNSEPYKTYFKVIQDSTGANVQWLKTGKGEMFATDKNIDQSPIDLHQNDTKITNIRGGDKSTIDIVVYSLKRKGHDGNFLPVEKLGIPSTDYNEYIIAYRNPGREMGEVIPTGSIVAINTREKEPVSGEIYLFRFHYRGRGESKQYTYLIRRVQVKKGGRGLLLLSDNSQLYPPLELDPEDIEDDTIMGRIMLIHGRRYLYDDLINKTG